MGKQIKFARNRVIKKSNGFLLGAVEFQDESGKLYQWCPKWEDLGKIFFFAASTERNNGGNGWMPLTKGVLLTLDSIFEGLSGKSLKPFEGK